MPAERFYINADLSEIVTLEGTELHHLLHVMRIKIDETVELVNGKGFLAEAKLIASTKSAATLQILKCTETPTPAQRYILALPLMRPAKLELVIEKCTELGVDAFYLYPAAHSEKDSLSEHQLERLNHIAIQAMKQCGRLNLPPITLFPSLKALLAKATLPIFFGDTDPKAKRLCPQSSALFISGPESGFSPKEHELLVAHATGVSLHHNILRAETAPIAALIQIDKGR